MIIYSIQNIDVAPNLLLQLCELCNVSQSKQVYIAQFVTSEQEV